MSYYLCFKIKKIPDLTMIKYSVYDISGQEDLIRKHGVFLRQLHRMGLERGICFHLLYFYDGREGIEKGKRLQIIFYATAEDPKKLNLLREFVTTSVLSTYYDFYCYEVGYADDYQLCDGLISYRNLSGIYKHYNLNSRIKTGDYDEISARIRDDRFLYCEINPITNEVEEVNSESFMLDGLGRIACDRYFGYGAYLRKKDYHLYAQNKLIHETDTAKIPIYSIMEWIPNDLGRLYNVMKLMEGYNETAALRIDLFPQDVAESFIDNMSSYINELRERMSKRDQGRDDNSDTVLKSIEAMSKKLMKFPQFCANIIAFADHKDIAVMLADSVGAEAVESGSYLIKYLQDSPDAPDGYSIYSFDQEIVAYREWNESSSNMLTYTPLYTLDEVRPIFSLPVLYPGETIECLKETDPEFDTRGAGSLHLGRSSTGYDVSFPVNLFKKHAFISGVPGAGKTNTMLYMVSELWNRFGVPFLVLEPAKKEYRALAKVSKLAGMEAMKDICIFSPGADTKFPLHINPFEFPEGLTLAEHITNLKAVFFGAFELPPPSPHFIDTCIEQVYLDKGWNSNSRNTGSLPYPTMQDLFDSLNVAVQKSNYQGEMLGNLRSVMEVRIGSLLKREIGNVYNVERSSFLPHEWLERPVIIELEALGEGPANFMALLISTLIRETLNIRKAQKKRDPNSRNKTGVNHIIFYEEAHNLVGPTKEAVGDKVDPKISATKYLVNMLAEVRALNEGIVIADQLPTVMAPEVLKNTGLKIGHRITANDDRELLGSTMSASVDQLAEQSIYMPGEALVFYEGLLKPFKMKMAKWQKTMEEYCELATDELRSFLEEYYENDDTYTTDNERIRAYFDSVYDSPTNDELHALIRNYPVYNELLDTSREIILSRTFGAFAAQRIELEKLSRQNLLPLFQEGNRITKEIALRKRGFHKRLDKAAKAIDDIAVLEEAFHDVHTKFASLSVISGVKKITVSEKLASILAQCNQLLFSNLAITDNYGAQADRMSYEIIRMYLNTISALNVRQLFGKNLYNEVQHWFSAADRSLREFVDLSGNGCDCRLKGTAYHDSLYELATPLRLMELTADFRSVSQELNTVVDWKENTFDSDGLTEIAKKYEQLYFRWMKAAAVCKDSRTEFQSEVISLYLQLFTGSDLLCDKRMLAYILFPLTVSVQQDIRNYVHWDSRHPGQEFLRNTAAYDRLRDECTVFTKLELCALHYRKTVLELKDVLELAARTPDRLEPQHLNRLALGYRDAFDQGTEISLDRNVNEALKENVKLLYLVLEVAQGMSDQQKRELLARLRHSYELSLQVRKKRFAGVQLAAWKNADAEFTKFLD